MKYSLVILTTILLSGCGTAVNGTISAYENNVATNQISAGQNVLKAKIFALCMTPVYDLANATAEQRAAIKAGCVPSDSATQSGAVVDAMGSVTSPAK